MIDHFNSSLKTFSFMITSVIIGFFENWHLNLIMCIFGLGCLITSKRVTIKSLIFPLIPLIILALSFFVAGYKFYNESLISNRVVMIGGHLTGALENGLILSSRLFAYGLIGLAYSLTNNRLELITSFIQQCKMSPKLAYGILAALHLLPNLKKDYNKIRLNYQIRGLKVSYLSSKPLFTLLIRTINWSEYVSRAMEAKGLNETRTSYLVMKVTLFDTILAISLPLITLILGIMKI